MIPVIGRDTVVGMRTNLRGAVVATCLVLCGLVAGVARADVIRRPPDDCPVGSLGGGGHCGPVCVALVCMSDADCDRGMTCQPVKACVHAIPCFPDGLTIHGGACIGETCANDEDTCQSVKLCVEGGDTGSEDSSGGSGGTGTSTGGTGMSTGGTSMSTGGTTQDSGTSGTAGTSGNSSTSSNSTGASATGGTSTSSTSSAATSDTPTTGPGTGEPTGSGANTSTGGGTGGTSGGTGGDKGGCANCSVEGGPRGGLWLLLLVGWARRRGRTAPVHNVGTGADDRT